MNTIIDVLNYIVGEPEIFYKYEVGVDGISFHEPIAMYDVRYIFGCIILIIFLSSILKFAAWLIRGKSK